MQYRTQVELKIEPDGPEKPGAIETFRLERHITRQVRRSDRETWLGDSGTPDWHKREDLITGITRSQLADLIAEAADWLSYIEGDNSGS